MAPGEKILPDLHTQVAVQDHDEEKKLALESMEKPTSPTKSDPLAHHPTGSPSRSTSGDAESEEEYHASLPDTTDIERVDSTTSKAPEVVQVPRTERAGLLASLSLLYEAQEPRHYPRKYKWLVTFWVALAAAAAPMGSAIILPALNQIAGDFQATPTITNLSVALYMLAMSIFPLWWSSFSETYGRRSVYIISFTLFTIFNVLAAVSPSIGMFIAMRLLSGGTSAAVQAVGAGTIADIWDVHERGRAMGIFYLGPLCGPLVSPVIGGGLTEGLGWRSTQYFQAIFGAVIVLGILLCLPETHIHRKPKPTTPALTRSTSRSTTASSVAQSTKRYLLILRKFFVDPLLITRYLAFPAVFLTVYYASISFGALYFLNISVESTFSHAPYNFSEIVVGCLYMFNSAGYFVSSIFGGRWVDKIMHREARRAGRYDARGRLIFIPTDRMKENVWVAAFAMPAALIWYGWTAEYGTYFLAPMAANFVFGVGSMLLFGAATTMLTEMMPRNASNGVALNNFVRNIFGFIGAFVAEPAIRGIGNGWLFTILGLVALVSGLGVIALLERYGERWRLEMDEAEKRREERSRT